MNKKMRLTSILVLLTMVLLTIPSVMATTVIDVVIDGNDGEFDIYTRMTHVDDWFHGESDGAFNAWQTVRVGSSSTWASDGADIDRYGEFTGTGSLTTVSEWDSLGTVSWNWGSSTQYAGVISDDSGYLGQNLHFGSNWGGVNDVDQWKKQRNMDIGAGSNAGECNYEIYFGAVDMRANNWEFDFTATGYGDADLHVDSSYSTYQHGSFYDGYNVLGERGNPSGYFFEWTGDLNQITSIKGDRGYDLTEFIDTLNDIISGDAKAW